ncbi:unnamed protein product [Absidia cylindrospora]
MSTFSFCNSDYRHSYIVQMWDIKPFFEAGQCIKVFGGAPHGLKAIEFTSRSVVIWEVSTGKILYKLPGQKGRANDAEGTLCGDDLD